MPPIPSTGPRPFKAATLGRLILLLVLPIATHQEAEAAPIASPPSAGSMASPSPARAPVASPSLGAMPSTAPKPGLAPSAAVPTPGAKPTGTPATGPFGVLYPGPIAPSFQPPTSLPQALPGDASAVLLKGGPEAKLIYSNNYLGMLYGLQGMRFLTPHFYAGAMFYKELPLIGTEISPDFTYYGLLAGYESPAWHGIKGDGDLLLGWVNGSADTTKAGISTASLEPSISLSFPVPYLRATRCAVELGYLVMPLAMQMSGPTLGLRGEFKDWDVNYPVAD